MPQSPQEANMSPEKGTTWGMAVQEITPELARGLGLNPDEGGVVIASVQPGSPAGEAGLQSGDVIKEVNRQKIKGLRDYNQGLEKTGQSLLLLIKRGSGRIFVVLQAASNG
jgi:serine protease Do